MKIKIFNNIDDPLLKKGWEHLQESENVFPQMFYQWIQPWWKNKKGKKELYIIAVVDGNEKILGIAPFCIEKKFGIKILQSIPIHFGDFYSFIVKENNDRIFQKLFNQVNSFKKWSYIKINLVRNDHDLFIKLNKGKYQRKHSENIIEADLSNKSFDDYLLSINRKVRGEYRRRLRKLNELGDIEFSMNSDFVDYITYENDFKKIYELRWKDIDKKLPGDEIYVYRKHALEYLSSKNKAVFILLKLNNELIAYRFGIIHHNKYHDYKISFNPKYYKFGLGSIISGLLIQELIAKNIKYLDHGVGNYSYKEDWSPRNRKIGLYDFHSFKKKIIPKAYFMFENKYKDIIKMILKR